MMGEDDGIGNGARRGKWCMIASKVLNFSSVCYKRALDKF